ncbi:hypothetical protein HDE_08670 [Halotydeus destructor]|nr:hypothetical protein HDE_08670 [Halotydeus destructor]
MYLLRDQGKKSPVKLEDVSSDAEYFSDTDSNISFEELLTAEMPSQRFVLTWREFANDIWPYEERLDSFRGQLWYGQPTIEAMADAGFMFRSSDAVTSTTTVICPHCSVRDEWTYDKEADPIVRHAQLDLLCTFLQNKLMEQ